MVYTIDDYHPPLEGHLDDRRLAMFADNNGWSWEFSSEFTDLGLRVTVTVNGQQFTAEDANSQKALDAATDQAIAALEG